MSGWTIDSVELSGLMKKINGVDKSIEMSMCIECIEWIGSQVDRLDSCHIRHIAIKLVKWINRLNYPCASSASSALGHKLTGWIPAISDILPQSQ
ncbi:MAG: hypothetical protein EZS28_040719 [Streblomastix strix]|uniref:Uncharacterized protein n=1 Tax=Streblomastix strix TaxID=222440 RepID=A0A5J4U0J7_9EUKA|nr:MAG: hypothetical protein EZS28_040719 [Streblomastix strix]